MNIANLLVSLQIDLVVDTDCRVVDKFAVEIKILIVVDLVAHNLDFLVSGENTYDTPSEIQNFGMNTNKTNLVVSLPLQEQALVYSRHILDTRF